MSIKKINLGDEGSQSQDLVADNISKLKALFPEIMTEGKIDFDVLKHILGEEIEEGEEYYRFTWAGKAQARREAHKPSTGTLRPCPEESVDWENTENIYIEGDNLEVLKLLQKSYGGKIKMIYIDPPYNTGKDFVYKDNYKDNLRNYQELTGQVDSEGNKLSTNSDSDGRYHSKWLNMMYPRLRLARNLLTDDGVIFMSIDDNEVENLRKVSDEIFGEDNFIGVFCVRSTPNARDYGHIGKMHEYCLFYGKNIQKTETYHLIDESKKFTYNDETSGFNIHPLYNSNEAFHKGNRPNLYYPFYIYIKEPLDENGFYKIGLEEKEGSEKVFPPLSKKNSVQFVWRWGKDKSKENLNKEIVGYKTSEGEFRIIQKMRTSSKVIRSMFDSKAVSSRRGTAEVEAIFGKKVFSFPKPITLIKDFIKASTKTNEIIMDFFSGSASSCHAILEASIEDHIPRKFIQVQLPELTENKSEAFKAGYRTIAEIGKERIRRAAIKIAEENPDIAKDLDLGFKVFKLDSSNIQAWDGSVKDENGRENDIGIQIKVFENHIKADRSEEDILYEILLKYGLDLTLPISVKEIEGKKIFNIGLGALFVCLANGITKEVSEGIGAWKDELEPEVCRVVFKDSGFKGDADKTNAMQTLKRFGITEVKSI